MLQRVAACGSLVQCVVVCRECNEGGFWQEGDRTFCGAACCSMLQYVAVCCSMLQYVAVCCSVLQCAAVCCRLKRVQRKLNLIKNPSKEPLIERALCTFKRALYTLKRALYALKRVLYAQKSAHNTLFEILESQLYSLFIVASWILRNLHRWCRQNLIAGCQKFLKVSFIVFRFGLLSSELTLE